MLWFDTFGGTGFYIELFGDGSIRLQTILELAEQHGIPLPADDLEGLIPGALPEGGLEADLRVHRAEAQVRRDGLVLESQDGDDGFDGPSRSHGVPEEALGRG